MTKVDAKNKNFTIEVTFSAKNLKDSFPEAGKIYNITFTGSTTPGGAPEAVRMVIVRLNQDRRLNNEENPNVTGKVLSVISTNKTFTAEVTLSAKNLTSPLPEVGRSYDITFQTTPGGPPVAMKADMSRDTHNPAP